MADGWYLREYGRHSDRDEGGADGWGRTVTVVRDPQLATRLPYVAEDDWDERWDDGAYADVTYVRGGFDRVNPHELPPPVRFRSPVREFVRKYGWRAYALPVLVVLTVVALATAKGPEPRRATAATGAVPTRPTAAAPSTPATTPSTSSAPAASASASAQPSAPTLKSYDLPPGAPYTLQGKGTFRVLPGTTRAVGSGQRFTYDIEVENGITGVDLTAFAKLVDTTLDDKRSWSGHGVQLQRVANAADATFHVSLTSAMTVRSLCGYDIAVETSCYDPGQSRVVFNVARWVRGAVAYQGHLDEYRVYMINHEDGHALGHDHAHSCLANGMAPAMMQQTYGLISATTHRACTLNVWPYPVGATDAPGAEDTDTDANNEYYLAG
ncbi:MAG: DUF3152 domain-containing protein [Jatrophihabitans sp.]|uniref:DUF3152 domain-containing protein n=1 Tax=Jatrophihabitans sp. TaxID=1932789 RepID=UPI003F7E7407